MKSLCSSSPKQLFWSNLIQAKNRRPPGLFFYFPISRMIQAMERTPTIIYEDKDVLVLNKPSGLVVHHDGRTTETTLTDWLLLKYPEIKGVGEPLVIRRGKEEISIDRPGIVHRLDKETSGVIIVAKHQKAHAFLKEQFQNRLAQKTYLAAVWGNIKEDSGIIDAPIGKSKNDFRQWQAGDKARGLKREAVTYFKVLKRIEENGEHFCLCEVSPKTGRTHQIRVHMKYIHHPLVGDGLYASARLKALGFDRLALHAHKLTITLPNGTQQEFLAELPEPFKTLVK